MWHHHDSQKRFKYKWIADPTSATSPVSPRFCDRPARPCFCSDHKPRVVYLDSVETFHINFQQTFLFLQQHWLAYLFRTVQCQQISWRRNCPLFKLRPSATSRYTRSKGASNKANVFLIWLGCKVDPGPSGSRMGVYQYAAVSVDSIPCAKIGK